MTLCGARWRRRSPGAAHARRAGVERGRCPALHRHMGLGPAHYPAPHRHPGQGTHQSSTLMGARDPGSRYLLSPRDQARRSRFAPRSPPPGLPSKKKRDPGSGAGVTLCVGQGSTADHLAHRAAGRSFAPVPPRASRKRQLPYGGSLTVRAQDLRGRGASFAGARDLRGCGSWPRRAGRAGSARAGARP